MKSRKNEKGEFVGTVNEVNYIINDDKAGLLYEHWKAKNISSVIENILGDKNLWSANLNEYNNFTV